MGYLVDNHSARTVLATVAILQAGVWFPDLPGRPVLTSGRGGSSCAARSLERFD